MQLWLPRYSLCSQRWLKIHSNPPASDFQVAADVITTCRVERRQKIERKWCAIWRMWKKMNLFCFALPQLLVLLFFFFKKKYNGEMPQAISSSVKHKWLVWNKYPECLWNAKDSKLYVRQGLEEGQGHLEPLKYHQGNNGNTNKIPIIRISKHSRSSLQPNGLCRHFSEQCVALSFRTNSFSTLVLML